MMLLNNPFTYRSTIFDCEAFFGRRRELRDLYTRVLAGQSVSLVGERRMGKSSLMRAMAFDTQRAAFGVPANYRFAFVDLQLISGATEGDFLDYLGSVLAEQLGVDSGPPSRGTITRLAGEARSRNVQLVISMDEFDELTKNKQIPPQMYSFLRALASEYRIAFTIASKEGSIEPIVESAEIGSSFLNIFGTIHVGPLEPRDAREAVQVPSERAGLSFSEEEIGWVLALGGHQAFFLQVAAYYLFMLKQSEMAAIARREALERDFAADAAPHLQYIYTNLEDAERNALADWYRQIRPLDQSLLGILTRKGVVCTDDGAPRVFSTAFAALLDVAPQPRRDFFTALRAMFAE